VKIIDYSEIDTFIKNGGAEVHSATRCETQTIYGSTETFSSLYLAREYVVKHRKDLRKVRYWPGESGNTTFDIIFQ